MTPEEILDKLFELMPCGFKTNNRTREDLPEMFRELWIGHIETCKILDKQKSQIIRLQNEYNDCSADRDKWKLYAEKAEEGFAETSSWYQGIIIDHKITYEKQLGWLREHGIVGPLDFEPPTEEQEEAIQDILEEASGSYEENGARYVYRRL